MHIASLLRLIQLSAFAFHLLIIFFALFIVQLGCRILIFRICPFCVSEKVTVIILFFFIFKLFVVLLYPNIFAHVIVDLLNRFLFSFVIFTA